MRRLANHFEEFVQLDTVLLPILVDGLENAKKMEEKYAMGKYPICYDKDEAVSKMLNQQWLLLKLGRMPGMLIANKAGIIKYAYYSDNMHDIPKMEDVLEMVKETNST